MNIKKTLLIGALAGAILVSALSFADEKEEKIQWVNVPAVVQNTITANSGDGKIEEIEKETETKNGRQITVYEAKVKKPDGKKIKIKVSKDGKLIELEDD